MSKPRLLLGYSTKLINIRTTRPDVSDCLYVCRAYMNPRVVCVCVLSKDSAEMTVQWIAVNNFSNSG